METIKIYLAEALRLYLAKCYEEGNTPDEKVKQYFNERIKELGE